MHPNAELDDLGRLLTLSAEVARRIADIRERDRQEIYDLANQIAEVAETLQDIARGGRVQEADDLTVPEN